ncbi:Enoyl-CoA hydratase/carnithine racemase [Allopseudospirillum japonicum]|uniref:3-hydroxyisobutyryl-CoA hydrolase n=2 Tax=Allopseudospirillum japonicum TaxID=64971 RepID=A0A1H6T586_9GAMM|nr:Enoyl-CoA hydratase/carnithine racemase [Allopseudospirillum japonicum]
MTDAVVIFETLETQDGLRLGVARLNSPKSLNALSYEMIQALYPQLSQWAQDDSICAVWLEGSGDKAFCAGGDIVQLYNSMRDTPEGAYNPYAERFFTDEYRLDHLIHTYPKPVILWGHGIVMGGGLGLSAGASHRVVTEKSRIAMPEITIGLYPDVGGSFFLNRMPGRVGLFLGLTGTSINAADALFVGLADRFITHAQKAQVQQQLLACSWQGQNAHAQVTHVLREFETQSQADLPTSPVRAHFDVIQQLTDADTHVERAQNIMAYAGEDPWLQGAAERLRAGSPLSMLVIQEQLERCRHLSLAEVFRSELSLSVAACHQGEFQEGIRALLIDKDRQPQWRYDQVNTVNQEALAAFFATPWASEKTHPLADL